MKRQAFVKFLVECAMCTAIMSIVAPWCIMIGPIPITLGLFIVLLISSIFSWKKVWVSLLVYVIMGLIGVPVFSGFSSGIYAIAGLTGGYLLGYFPCSFIVSFFCAKYKHKRWLYIVFMTLGTLSCYIIGMLWFSFVTKSGLMSAFLAGVFPFIVIDFAKIFTAAYAGFYFRKHIKGFRSSDL